MKKLLLIPSMLAFVGIGLIGCNQQQESTQRAEEVNEEIFEEEMDMEDVGETITEVYGVNQMIIEIAQIAQSNTALSQELLDMNEKVLNDHQSVKDQLTQLANQYNMVLPANINYGEGSEVNDLREAEADDFTDKYVDILSQASDDMERKLEEISDELEDDKVGEIGTFVQNTISLVRAHEESVDNLDEEI